MPAPSERTSLCIQRHLLRKVQIPAALQGFSADTVYFNNFLTYNGLEGERWLFGQLFWDQEEILSNRQGKHFLPTDYLDLRRTWHGLSIRGNVQFHRIDMLLAEMPLLSVIALPVTGHWRIVNLNACRQVPDYPTLRFDASPRIEHLVFECHCERHWRVILEYPGMEYSLQRSVEASSGRLRYRWT